MEQGKPQQSRLLQIIKTIVIKGQLMFVESHSKVIKYGEFLLVLGLSHWESLKFLAVYI